MPQHKVAFLSLRSIRGHLTRLAAVWMVTIMAMLFGPSSAAFAQAPPPVIHIDSETLPASGKQQTQFSVSRFGRYSIAARSRQGLALQLVDRLAGPGEWSGEIGVSDGRIDAFLDRGDYQVRTQGATKNVGDARVDVRAFSETNESFPFLVEQKLQQSTLNDLQQRSYWIEINNRRAVHIEASGRFLEDLRLWREGTWLVDASPDKSVVIPRTGQPVRLNQIETILEPGFYLVTAYGGVGEPWTAQSSDASFQIQFGVRQLGDSGRQRFTVGQHGIDRWLIPKGANYFRLELDKPGLARLEVRDFLPENRRDSHLSFMSLEKNARIPVAEIFSHNGEAAYQLVTVTSEAGTPYVLQHFEQRSEYLLSGSGAYWISTLNSGDAQDSIDDTVVMTSQENNDLRMAYVVDRAIPISKTKHWQRRCNLLGITTLFLRVEEAGKYIFEGSGVDLRFRLEPLVANQSGAIEFSASRVGKAVWDIPQGLYVLSILPDADGIATIAIQAEGLAAAERGLQAGTPMRANVRFASLQLDTDYRYRLYVNNIPGMATGLIVRPLPLDLTHSLPITLSPNERLELPITVPEAGILRVLREDGQAFSFALGEQTPVSHADVKSGAYKLVLHGAGKTQVALNVVFAAARLESGAPLPHLPENAGSLPNFPVLSTKTPQFFELARTGQATFKVNVERSALYRIESTGLLSTEGVLRTRTNPALYRAAANGIGRNFLVQQYVREGDYQLSVSASGQSTGHAGVQLVANDLVDGGYLAENTPSRITLPVGRAVAYQFKVVRTGEFRLRAMGLGRDMAFRLEDAQGWPLVSPVSEGSMTHEFEPGTYRVIVLPTRVEARVLTFLEPVPVSAKRAGHGPFEFPLGASIEHLWEEPKENPLRRPDQWEFNVPGRADVTISMDNEMDGALEKIDSPAVGEMPTLYAGKPWSGELAKGRYRLNVKNSRMNNFVTYHVTINNRQLLEGQSRAIRVPGEMAVSMGTDGFVELYSIGANDVQARLYNEQNQLVARADDRADDWNFLIANHLPAGRYRLAIDSVNGQAVDTTVFLRAPRDKLEKPKAIPAQWTVNDEAMHVYPLNFPKEKNLAVFRARGAANVGLAIERQTAQGWEVLGSRAGHHPRLEFVIPVEPGNYRLRQWLADGRRAPVEMRAAAAMVTPVPEFALVQGLQGVVIEGSSIVAAQTKAGLLRLGNREGLRAVVGQGALRNIDGENLPVGDQLVWMAADAKDDKPVAFSARRVTLAANGNKPYSVPVSKRLPVGVDLAEGDGPLLLLAQAKQGQALISVLNQGESSSNLDVSSIDLFAQGAAAVSLKSVSPRALVRNASSYATLDVDLQYYRFKQQASRAVENGVVEAVLSGYSATPFLLTSGSHLVEIALPAYTAAVAVTDGRITAMAWAGTESRAVEWNTKAERILLLSASAAGGRMMITAKQSSGSTEDVISGSGSVWQHTFATSGVTKVPVAVGSKETLRLHISGGEHAQFLGNDGQLFVGNSISSTSSGQLYLAHTAGQVVVAAEFNVAQRESAAMGATISVPSRVALSGSVVQLRLVPTEPTFFHVQINVPVIARWIAGGNESVSIHPSGARLSVFAAGEARLILQPYAGAALSGEAYLTKSPLSALTEGVGAEVLVMGGDTRLFSFSVSAPTTVGVGVRASNDVVSAQITDSTGKILSEGIVHLLRLEPGRYVLAVQAPTHVAPVRVQPILIGLNPTPTTPPPEMIRRFVESNEDTGLLSAVAELKAVESDTEAGAERSPSGDEPNAEDDSGQEQPSEDSQ